MNTPLASDDMAFVDSLKYQCAKFGIERPEGHIHVHFGLINRIFTMYPAQSRTLFFKKYGNVI